MAARRRRNFHVGRRRRRCRGQLDRSRLRVTDAVSLYVCAPGRRRLVGYVLCIMYYACMYTGWQAHAYRRLKQPGWARLRRGHPGADDRRASGRFGCQSKRQRRLGLRPGGKQSVNCLKKKKNCQRADWPFNQIAAFVARGWKNEQKKACRLIAVDSRMSRRYT